MPDGIPTRADQLIALAKLAIPKLTLTDLTSAEEKFFRDVAEGRPADFSDKNKPEDNDPSKASQWSEDRVLHAPCIAWLCTDPDAARFLTHRGISAQGARIDGALDLQFAKVEVPLSFQKCAFVANISLQQADLHSLTLTGSHTADIAADFLGVKRNVLMDDGFKAQGEVRLLGASIGGKLDCSKGQFSNPKMALSIDGARIAGDALLCNHFKAEGEVLLSGASIGGDLDCENGKFSHPDYRALNADGVKVAGSVYLRKGFKAQGEVWLLAASIGGDLDCENGHFFNSGHNALTADRVKVGGNVFLRGTFIAKGAVQLPAASIGGDLDCNHGKFSHSEHNALTADRATIGGIVIFENRFKVDGKITLCSADLGREFRWQDARDPKKATLDLCSAKVKMLRDEKASWPDKGQLYLQGFVYEELYHRAPASAKDRIDWLNLNNEDLGKLPGTATRSKKRAFFAQPYQQLASVLRNAGQEDEADEILIEKNRKVRQWTRAGTGPWWWYNVIGPRISYGYRPMVTFLWSLLVIALGSCFFEVGNRCGLISPTHKEAYEEQNGKAMTVIREDYPRFNSIVYSAEMFVPLVKFYQAEYWLPNANRDAVIFKCGHAMHISGQALRMYLWLHIALGWTLTTVWVAGLTGVIKKAG